MYDELVKRLRKLSGTDNLSEFDEAADAIEELVGFVQEAERDRDEYRERLDKANDAIEELQKVIDGLEAHNDALFKRIDELEKLCAYRPWPEPPKEEA